MLVFHFSALVQLLYFSVYCFVCQFNTDISRWHLGANFTSDDTKSNFQFIYTFITLCAFKCSSKKIIVSHNQQNYNIFRVI